jgi:hypothetical protein
MAIGGSRLAVAVRLCGLFCQLRCLFGASSAFNARGSFYCQWQDTLHYTLVAHDLGLHGLVSCSQRMPYATTAVPLLAALLAPIRCCHNK